MVLEVELAGGRLPVHVVNPRAATVWSESRLLRGGPYLAALGSSGVGKVVTSSTAWWARS